MPTRRFLLATAAGLAVATLATGAARAEYPERPISMIVAAAPGGGTDILARTFSPFVEKHLGGASITIINKPGAGTEVGLTAIATAKPDGYTIGMINVPFVVAIPIERKAAFTLDSFALMANLVDDSCAFSVKPDSPFKTLAELVEYAKKNPGAVTVGTSGVGSDDHFAMLLFEKAAGIKLTHVPFASGAPVRAATLGGHIAVGAFNISETVDYLKEGSIRVLGVMAKQRSDLAPEVLTFAEQGYNVTMSSQRGMGGPAGIPKDRLDKLLAAITQAVKDPGFKEAVEKMNIPLDYMAAADYEAYLRNMDTELQAMWKTDPWKKK